MLKNKSKIIIGVVLAIITIAAVLFLVFFKNSTVEALSKYGSRGSEVTQIQTKLKRWGYYNGNVDGIYGTQTVNAVKYFQRKNGLTADGIAGPATLKAVHQAIQVMLIYCQNLFMVKLEENHIPDKLQLVLLY